MNANGDHNYAKLVLFDTVVLLLWIARFVSYDCNNDSDLALTQRQCAAGAGNATPDERSASLAVGGPL